MDYIAELQKDYDALAAELQNLDNQERELAEKRHEILGKLHGIELAAQKFSEMSQKIQQQQLNATLEEGTSPEGANAEKDSE